MIAWTLSAGDLSHCLVEFVIYITMLTFPGGKERTEAEFRSLLKASSFELQSITPTTTMISVVEGKPV